MKKISNKKKAKKNTGTDAGVVMGMMGMMMGMMGTGYIEHELQMRGNQNPKK